MKKDFRGVTEERHVQQSEAAGGGEKKVRRGRGPEGFTPKPLEESEAVAVAHSKANPKAKPSGRRLY